MHSVWENLSESEYQERSDKAKRNWDSQTKETKNSFVKKGIGTVQVAGKRV